MKPADLPLAVLEHASLRTWLMGKGLSAAQATLALGIHDSRTRRQIAVQITAWLATRPKA